MDRWRQFDETYDTHSSVDMKNFDDAGDGSVKLGIKQVHGVNDAPGPYELYRFELNCSAEKVRTLSWAEYDASGALGKSSPTVPAAIALNPGEAKVRPTFLFVAVG